jgi:hypothetical protein
VRPHFFYLINKNVEEKSYKKDKKRRCLLGTDFSLVYYTFLGQQCLMAAYTLLLDWLFSPLLTCLTSAHTYSKQTMTYFKVFSSHNICKKNGGHHVRAEKSHMEGEKRLRDSYVFYFV